MWDVRERVIKVFWSEQVQKKKKGKDIWRVSTIL